MDTRRRGYDVCDVFLKLKNHKLYRHSHVGGNLLFLFVPAGQWIPAVAGMTGVWRARFLFINKFFLKKNPQTGDWFINYPKYILILAYHRACVP